jgi:formylglycine-generating enzyme required for sulfatase activity
MGENPWRYRGFISYSQKDKSEARKLHRWLETYRAPRGVEAASLERSRKLGRFFRDDEEMGAAADLGATLRGAIEDSESLIVVCSPYSAQSKWVNAEINHFRRTGRGNNVFAVIVGGVPNSGAQATECLPPALRGVVDPDHPDAAPLEPLALDMRRESRRRACARLAAGLLGVPFDQLWRRDRQRRMRQAIGTTALWGTVLAVIVIAYLQTPAMRPLITSWVKYRPYVHATASLAAGPTGSASEFQDCAQRSDDCPRMIVVPQGAFNMGGAPNAKRDGAAYDFEHPIRTISVPRFALSEFEITVSDWRACVAGGGCKTHPEPDRMGQNGGNLPVTNVTWNDAQEYVAWLSRMTRQTYRLPSEAEWEYAARGHTSANAPYTEYPWGDEEPVCDRGAQGSVVSVCEDERALRPVGQLGPTAFGLYDMVGNVQQWVQDCFWMYNPATPDARPVEMRDCSARVLRGGSFQQGADYLRSAARDQSSATFASGDIGFRVARSLGADLAPRQQAREIPGSPEIHPSIAVGGSRNVLEDAGAERLERAPQIAGEQTGTVNYIPAGAPTIRIGAVTVLSLDTVVLFDVPASAAMNRPPHRPNQEYVQLVWLQSADAQFDVKISIEDGTGPASVIAPNAGSCGHSDTYHYCEFTLSHDDMRKPASYVFTSTSGARSAVTLASVNRAALDVVFRSSRENGLTDETHKELEGLSRIDPSVAAPAQVLLHNGG